jgi:hypothetical protein
VVAGLISWTGRNSAFNVAVCGWIPCGLFMVLTGLSVRRDEDAMQARLMDTVQAIRQEMVLLMTDRDESDGVSSQ